MHTLKFADAVLFLSTLSLRRATRLGLLGWLRTLISIHALLAESDNRNLASHCRNNNFYPRSPCGERRHPKTSNHPHNTISIHALLAESDSPCCGWLQVVYYFYPRSPCGERRYLCMYVHNLSHISIHALLAESDGEYTLYGRIRANFYPRSPCGERRGAL